MSLAIGAALSSSTKMGLEGEEREGESADERLNRQMSEASVYATEDDDDEEEQQGIKGAKAIDLGPRVSIKDQLEKDKVYKSPRKISF